MAMPMPMPPSRPAWNRSDNMPAMGAATIMPSGQGAIAAPISPGETKMFVQAKGQGEDKRH